MKTTLLIDGDIIAYEAAAAAEEVINWGTHKTKHLHHGAEEAGAKCDIKLDQWAREFKADILVCLSCRTEDGWRKALLPTYKHNRDPDAKPILLGDVKDYLRENWPVYERPTLEADDVMGILSTSTKIIPGKKIIVSIDKDMKTIPGWLYNPMRDRKPRHVTEEQADYWHLYQTLVGDTTDGYKGCPGIGPKKAEAILNGPAATCVVSGDPWAAVVEAFQKAYEKKTRYATSDNTPAVRKGYEVSGYELRGPVSYEEAESYALLQARVARICRNTDYDFKKKEVKLWTPNS